MAENRTVVTEDSNARRLALALYLLRRSAHRIAADCERMLDGLRRAERKEWRESVAEAFVASRHLASVAAQVADGEAGVHDSQRLATLESLAREPQRRIADAMTRLLRFVPVSPEDELLLQDARAILETVSAPLPLAISARPLPGAHGGASASQPAAMDRVLVGEDDRAIRELLRRHLTRLGHEVIVAEDGAAVLEIAQRDPPDLILTDINMPRMDGIALLKRLKSDDRLRDIPVIVISSQEDLDTVATCIVHGAEDHIPKPYEPRLLDARVRASLERKHLRDRERDYLRRVGEITAAAEAVERERYAPGMLDALAADDDALGRLARVFDRMVTGLRSRQERLHRRLAQLKHDMAGDRHTEGDVAAVGPESPFASGQILAARYRILSQLGTGGMGTVYRARDLELGEDVAIKAVRRDLVSADPAIVDRLKSEIRLSRKISHRNVVRAHDLGEWQGTYFITMECVRGVTVEQLIDRRGRLSVESTLAIGTQLAEALAVAHECQIVHRDIKPANLLVDRDGVVKVMDFGIARSTDREDNLTRAGFVLGTPYYMAPEVLTGKAADACSDLFAAGVVLYECLSGRPPFTATSPLAILAQMSDGAFQRLGELVPNVPPSLEALIYQLLRFRPEDRVGSARDLAERLAETEHGARGEPGETLEMELGIELDIIENFGQQG